jgi:general secretion pathway protein C
VLLDRNGRLESLSLPHQNTGVLGANPVQAAVPTQNPAFDRVRRLISEDPALLSDIMRNQPVLMAGKLHGFRVYPGRNRQAFTRLGLRSGDLVIAINGTPLDDPARGDEIFRTIGSATEARVTVMRNGQQQDLTLNMSQVAQEAEQAVDNEAASPREPGRPMPQAPMPQPPMMPQAPEPEGTE